MFKLIKKAIASFFMKPNEAETPLTIYPKEPLIEEVHSLWDYLKIRDHTQAHHIISVIGFEEWVAMEEILRRARELFGVEYKNERSLYPYIKTLVDCGLMETANFGGKQRWRRKDLIVKAAEKKRRKPELEEEEALIVKGRVRE